MRFIHFKLELAINNDFSSGMTSPYKEVAPKSAGANLEATSILLFQS
jgi:hypothetical protein